MLLLRPEAALAARPGKTGAQTLPDNAGMTGRFSRIVDAIFPTVVSYPVRESARERQRDSVPELQRRN
jgi:hypothetical protein